MTSVTLREPARLAGGALLRMQSDDRLVSLARTGNERAFEAIVDRYRSAILRYCRGLLSPSRAEDAVQQVFLNAHGALLDGNPPRDLRPWLYRIAHNVSLNALREGGWDHGPIDERWSTRGRFEEDVERREELARALAAVRALPPRQRDALLLRELEGRSHEEIAAALGVTGGAVRQLLHRSRANLRAVATALTPPQLVERLVAWGGSGAATTPARAAEIATAGAGAGATASLAKLGAAAVVTGAVAGVGLSPQSPVDARSERAPSAADTTRDSGPDRAKASATTGGGPGRAERRRSKGSESGRRRASHRGRASRGGRFRGSSGSGESESSGSSGSSSGQRSGSVGSSGSGSGSSGSGSSGSGASRSGASRSGSSDSGPSPSDSSGSSSGSGSGSSDSRTGSGSSGSGSGQA